MANKCRVTCEKVVKKHKLNINDASGLIKLINETIIYMKKETSSNFLISEFPFLLKKETQLIDGIIDLITINKNIINIYDYKFSNDSPENLKIKYHQQIKIYNDALKASDFKFDRINCFLFLFQKKELENKSSCLINLIKISITLKVNVIYGRETNTCNYTNI